jgi:hypothetical protein
MGLSLLSSRMRRSSISLSCSASYLSGAVDVSFEHGSSLDGTHSTSLTPFAAMVDRVDRREKADVVSRSEFSGPPHLIFTAIRGALCPTLLPTLHRNNQAAAASDIAILLTRSKWLNGR